MFNLIVSQLAQNQLKFNNKLKRFKASYKIDTNKKIKCE